MKSPSLIFFSVDGRFFSPYQPELMLILLYPVFIDYAVVEKPLLMTWMQGGPDHIVLKNLDADGIRIIGSVLGQSIALDHYIRQVLYTDTRQQ